MYGYHLQYNSLTATIPDNPKKVVDKTVANTGDTVTYTVTQDISKATDSNFYYSSLVLKDVLNSNLAYQSLTVYDENNKNITATAGTTNYATSSRTLTYTFSNSYLKNIKYKGQSYKFVIKAKINSKVTSGNINNISSTIINNNTDYTLNSNTVTTKVPYKVIVNHVDEKGKALADSETIEGYEKDKYTTKAKNISGYELTKTPTNSTGTMSEDITTVNYVYRLKDASVVAQYVDEEGNQLAESETLQGKVFDEYETNAKDIYGYELIKTPENHAGTMKEEPITVTYAYRLKDTTVIARYVDEEGKEITDSETIKGKVFDEYETNVKNISGYALTVIPSNDTGIMEENEIDVVYQYRKLHFNISVSQELSKVDLNSESQNVSGKLEIDRKVVVNSLKLTYTIHVSNHSELDGSTVLCYDIPKGYIALEEDNLGWTIEGKVAYRNIDNLIIGEAREFTIVLTARTSEVTGIMKNKVTCKDSTCEPGFEETTLVDNTDTKEFIISISTGLKEHVTEIALEVLVVLSVLGIVLWRVRKRRR